MKPIPFLLLCLCVSPLFAETDAVYYSPEKSEKQKQYQKFLDAIPRRLALSGDLKTYVIDKNSGKVVHAFDGFLRDYWPDLDIILTELGSDDERRDTVLTLWNRATGKKIRSVMCSGKRPLDSDESAFRIIHRKALCWGDLSKTTDVVDLTTGKSVGTLPGFVRHVGDSFFIVEQPDDRISVCDATSLEVLYTVPGSKIQRSEDGLRFAAWIGRKGFELHMTQPGKRMDVTVYDLKTGKKLHTFPEIMDTKANWDSDLAINHDGTKLLMRTESTPAEVTLWDVDTGEKLWTIPFGGEKQSYYEFRFSEDGKVITAKCMPCLPSFPKDWPRFYVWNAQTGAEIVVLKSDGVEYFNGVNRLFDHYHSSPTSLYEAGTGKRIADITGYFAMVEADGKRFLTYNENTFYLWDSETGERLRTFDADGTLTTGLLKKYALDSTRLSVMEPIFDIDSRFAARMVVFDTESGAVISREDILPDGKNRDGQVAWKDNRRDIVFWNLETGQPIFTIRLEPSWYISGPVRFTPDGKHLFYSTKLRPLHECFMTQRTKPDSERSLATHP